MAGSRMWVLDLGGAGLWRSPLGSAERPPTLVESWRSGRKAIVYQLVAWSEELRTGFYEVVDRRAATEAACAGALTPTMLSWALPKRAVA